MGPTPQTLNQYIGTDASAVGTTIVAPDMETACKVYRDQLNADPVTMQCTKTNVKCVLPTQLVSFKTEVFDATGVAKTVCSATPEAYTLPSGTEQIFSAIAAEGWEFEKWTIDGVDASTDKVALLTIPAKESMVEIQAVFKAATA